MAYPQPIHPFPARMAPSIALHKIKQLPEGSIVLDPMMGSGTVVRATTEHGHHAIGRDVDPLAVLMTRVWNTPISPTILVPAAQQYVHDAQRLQPNTIDLPWIDNDPETLAFIDYWFEPLQRDALRRLSYILQHQESPESDALRLALSRIIITCEHGASRARDVSHSRPRRVYENNPFSVYDGFLKSTQRIAKRLEQEPPLRSADVALGDARRLTLADRSIDAVITSPPYLNAIDYLRGHRLALVWLGHQLGALRTIRAESIGAERAPAPGVDHTFANAVMRRMGLQNCLPSRAHNMVARYILDLSAMLTEIQRVLRPGGRAIFVIGNSCIHNVFVKNSVAVSTIANQLGFHLISRQQRYLPDSRRYMPPPTADQQNSIERRMRTEIVLSYQRQ